MLTPYNMIIEVIHNNSNSCLETNLNYCFPSNPRNQKIQMFYCFIPTTFVSLFVTELFSLVFCGFIVGAVKIDWDLWTLHIRLFVPSPCEQGTSRLSYGLPTERSGGLYRVERPLPCHDTSGREARTRKSHSNYYSRLTQTRQVERIVA